MNENDHVYGYAYGPYDHDYDPYDHVYGHVYVHDRDYRLQHNVYALQVRDHACGHTLRENDYVLPRRNDGHDLCSHPMRSSLRICLIQILYRSL